MVGHRREVAVPLPIGHLVHPDAVDPVQVTVVDVVGDDPDHDAGHSLRGAAQQPVTEACRQTVTGAPDEQALAAIMAPGSGVFRECPSMSS
jgi:hypothetical protein